MALRRSGVRIPSGPPTKSRVSGTARNYTFTSLLQQHRTAYHTQVSSPRPDSDGRLQSLPWNAQGRGGECVCPERASVPVGSGSVSAERRRLWPGGAHGNHGRDVKGIEEFDQGRGPGIIVRNFG